jgi:hypothetical protein
MTNGETPRRLAPGIIVKIGLPLLIGLITLVAAHAGGMSGGNSLVLTAVITFAVALILFIVDTEVRISAVNDHMAKGFAEIGRSAEFSAMMERSVVGTALLADFLDTSGQIDGRVNPLLQRLAQREVERVTSFMRQLPVGSEIAYDGEDRDWLLGLTRETKSSIDAISLSTLNAGEQGLDGGLWTSDLGIRYLELQREAINRKVRIRRIFVVENDEITTYDESFHRITQMQRVVGIEVRMLDHRLIPPWMQPQIFDFIVFDGTVSYEVTSATTFAVGETKPGILRTRLAPMPDRVRDLEDQFEHLWEAADPERTIDE